MRFSNPFFRSFIVAIPIFILDASLALKNSNPIDSFETGEVIGYVLFSHLMAVPIAGWLGKVAIKRRIRFAGTWLLSGFLYFGIWGWLRALQLLGAST